MMGRILILLLLTAIVGCATPGSPLGGPQDKTPPTVKSYSPSKESTEFQQKNIVITFDEWVQINNIQQSVIISPPINPEPVFTAKKNELSIHFKGDLDSNTTYSIFFGDAVKDNHEGNVADNLSYVFSTGKLIDSLSISGQVKSLDGTQIPNNTFVELYENVEDSVITQKRPKYIYKVDNSGNFNIQYLPKDSFRIFVLNDLNTNYLYDLPTEMIGKLDETIFLDSNVNDLTLPIVLPESKNYKIIDYNSVLQNNILSVELNKELNPQKDTISLKILDSGTTLPFYPKFTNKKIQYFILTDSLSARCELSIQGKIIDTLRVNKPSKSPDNPLFLPMGQLYQKDSILSAYRNRNFRYVSNIPIDKIDSSKIFFANQEDTIQIHHIIVDSQLWGFVISDSLPNGFDGHIYFQDSAILFLSGQYSDSSSYYAKYLKDVETGQVIFNIHFPSLETNYVMRVFDQKGILQFETSILGDTTYTYSTPYYSIGQFYIEVVEDLNNSGTWNNAFFWESIPPEKVFKSENYSIKPNWENSYDIKVEFDQQKSPSAIANMLDLISTSGTSSQKNSTAERNENNSPALSPQFNSPKGLSR